MAIVDAIFQVIQGLILLRIEGRVVGDADPGRLGSFAPAAQPFFAGFSSGDLACGRWA